jgi:hypothetical protein
LFDRALKDVAPIDVKTAGLFYEKAKGYLKIT